MKPLKDYDGLLLPVLQVLLALFTLTDASCRKDQIDSCKKAVKLKGMDTFHAGGKCQAKHYVQFTHMCTVNNYLPSTDFCCCIHDRKVLCCRYQQDWGNFRCTQADDTIETISDSGWFGTSSLQKLSLKILIPGIVIPIIIVIICVVCIVKCCCYNYDSDDNEYCDIPCLRKCQSTKTSKKFEPYPSTRPISKDEESCPLSNKYIHPSGVGSQFSTESTNSETKLLPSHSLEPVPVSPPTAPPLEGATEESAFVNFEPSNINNHGCSCNHKQNHPHSFRLDYESAPYQCGYTKSPSFSNNQSGSGVEQGGSACPSCSSSLPMPVCPPPAYELHRKDRVYT